MKRTIVIVVVAVIAVAIGWWAYSTYFAPPPEETDAEREAAAALAEMASVIWASGKLEPLLWADLSTGNSGTVAHISVAEGDCGGRRFAAGVG